MVAWGDGIDISAGNRTIYKKIASFIVSENDLLRERTANALGRIGRADYQLVAPYFKELFILAEDKSSNVRLSFIWASENIATNTPTMYEDYLPIFAELLNDENERVRIEAPEIFRVLGKKARVCTTVFREIGLYGNTR